MSVKHVAEAAKKADDAAELIRGILIRLSEELSEFSDADFPLKLGDDMVELLQEVSNAIGDLPGVWERVEAYLLGRGIEKPREQWDALRGLLF